MVAEQDAPIDVRIRRGFEADVPHLYFNAFAGGLGNGDITVVLERNGAPVATLNMSFTVAKTFAVAIGSLVAALETASERNIMTTEDIDQILGRKEKEK
jgi:hypothetical protein